MPGSLTLDNDFYADAVNAKNPTCHSAFSIDKRQEAVIDKREGAGIDKRQR